MQQTSDLDSTILRLLGQLKGCVAQLAGHYCPSQNCGCSSVGRAPPCQGGRREFEPRHPLLISLVQTCIGVGQTLKTCDTSRTAAKTRIRRAAARKGAATRKRRAAI